MGPLPGVSSPPASPGDKLWWADQVSEKMGTCNKADGSGSVVLRNSTTLVMHMKVYDESIQLGEAGPGPGQWAGVSGRHCARRSPGQARGMKTGSALLTTHGAPPSQGPGALQDWSPELWVGVVTPTRSGVKG